MHKRQFGRQRKLTGHDDCLWKALPKCLELSDFLLATPKKKNTYRLAGIELLQQRLKTVERPHFLEVLGKWRNTQPVFAMRFGSKLLTFQKGG